MEKMLYLECNSGISGDMTVAALLDLGADEKAVRDALESLKLEGYEIRIGRTRKCGIDACDFQVILEQDENWENHIHGHEHGHESGHTHEHRNLQDIYEILKHLKDERIRELSKRIFLIVAEAEAKAHGIPIEEVHFHEVGAVDSIVDIVAASACIVNLDIREVVVSSLAEGSGTVRCRHGIIPVPVPAVVNIAIMNELTLKTTGNTGEMVTPTGAAIAAAIRTKKSLPEQYTIQKIGMGAGKKDFDWANVLRAFMIEGEVEEKGEDIRSQGEELVWKLETNLDDCTGEALGYTMEKLMAAGARDVFYTPVYMKKNRPAYLLSVICLEKDYSVLEDIIFTHTTTIGIRRSLWERTVLERQVVEIETSYGRTKVKLCRRGKTVLCYPEYESVREICEREKKAFWQVYTSIINQYNQKEKEEE